MSLSRSDGIVHALLHFLCEAAHLVELPPELRLLLSGVVALLSKCGANRIELCDFFLRKSELSGGSVRSFRFVGDNSKLALW